MPSWLESYPGSMPNIHANGSILESLYTTPAQGAEVIEHYRKRFEAAGVRFQLNPDGSGTSIRADTSECDLLILIRKRPTGTFVDVNCATKSQDSSPSSTSAVEVITGQTSSTRSQVTRRGATGVHAVASKPSQPPLSAAELQERHQKRVAELGIHPVYHDAPAPPLVWPSWLVHINGAEIRIERGVDQSKKPFLEGRYTSSVPMTEIYNFYQDLLNSHEYRVHGSKLSTGQTISGVIQNAYGYVESSNYPDGAPGPSTVIRVTFSRSVLNGPIDVRIRFTAYEFVAPKSRGF